MTILDGWMVNSPTMVFNGAGHIAITMSFITAILISNAVIGETYPEPYELVSDLITLCLNIPVSIAAFMLVMRLILSFKKTPPV